MSSNRQRLLELLQDKAYENREVVLSSGKRSHFYIDVKRVSLTSEGAVLIGEQLFELIEKYFPQTEAVGGLTLGADPLATAIAYTSFLKKKPLEAFIVRKEKKEHGMGNLIEGGHALPQKSKVVIVEDVVTTGSSSLNAVQKVKDHGWEVLGIVAVVDRSEGGKEIIEKTGLKLYHLYERSDFVSL